MLITFNFKPRLHKATTKKSWGSRSIASAVWSEENIGFYQAHLDTSLAKGKIEISNRSSLLAEVGATKLEHA